jgi:hypothetical protein
VDEGDGVKRTVIAHLVYSSHLALPDGGDGDYLSA